jgi:Protein of unknown function (DUF3383)
MGISFTKYVQITSGVGGGAGVRERDLILRLFTASERVPAQTVVEMDDADDVASYFGISSPEYARAAFYFGFISKNISKPNKISFGRWAEVETSAKVFGQQNGAAALASFTPIATGSFNLTLGSYTADVTGINLTAAVSLAAVAAAIQAAVRLVVAGGAAWTAATVTYDAPSDSFNLTSGAPGIGAVGVAEPGAGTSLVSLLGWGPLAIFSPGVEAEEPVQSFIDSVETSDNFGTFAFVDDLSDAQVLAVATQNDTYNVRFHYTHAFRLESDAADLFAALSGLSGVSWTYAPLLTEFPELAPAAILAATNYSKRNSTQNYMFQQMTLTPSVVNTVLSNLFDAARANYYGRTQTAGQNIDFYQRGVMGGLATDPVDMNTYANEMWLKDAAGAAIMSLLLSLAKVSANAQGRSQLLAVLGTVIERATFNGTISIGKPLNINQKLTISTLTGDDNAWQQVFTLGYWIDVTLASFVTTDGRTEWKAVYTLIYSKDDVIRRVEGTHVLI